MAKDAAITVRLPVELKRRLELRAQSQRRSVSAQMVHDLEALLSDDESPVATRSSVRALGRFAGGKSPTEADFREVRSLLWGTLTARRS